MTGIEVYRVADGRITEMWSESDMSQVVALAEDPASTASAPT
jgi:predicted ester cyclase